MSTKKVINLVSKETSGIKKVLEQANNDNTASVIVVSQDKDGYITVSHSSITNGSLAVCHRALGKYLDDVVFGESYE